MGRCRGQWLLGPIACVFIAAAVLLPPGRLRAEPSSVRGDLQGALLRYEQWVQTQSDPTYGWKRDYVWPMSLYYLGEMYNSLHRLTGDARYRAEMVRAADTAVRVGPDALWFSYRGFEQYTPAPAAILNALFVELFLDAADATGDQRYRAHAARTVDQLRRTFFARALADDDHPQDYYTLNFVAIAQYLDRTGADDPGLRDLGWRLYERGMSTLDRSTARWHYNRDEHVTGFYDGHAAYYQNVSTLFFLRNADHVRKVFPVAYRDLSPHLRSLVNVALAGVEKDGTYFYADSVRSYTESAAQVIWLADLDQQVHGTDRTALIERAKQTLLERQVWEGAFYSNEIYHGPDIAYSDNIGWALSNWLFGGVPDLRPAAPASLLPAITRDAP